MKKREIFPFQTLCDVFKCDAEIAADELRDKQPPSLGDDNVRRIGYDADKTHGSTVDGFDDSG